MARVDAHTAAKITIVSLYCSAMVCLNHSYTIQATYAEQAGQAFAALDHGVQDSIKFGLARISTPFFFTLSAWLLFSRFGSSLTLWPTEVCKRIRSLLVPYLFWAVASFLVLIGLQSVPGLAGRSGRGAIVDLPWADLLELLLWNPVAHPLWFVRDLLLLVVAAPVVWLLMRWKPVAWVVLAVLLGAWFRWFEVREARAILFFCLGAYCALHQTTLVARGAVERGACVMAWFAVIALNTAHIMRVGDESAVLNNLGIMLGLAAIWSVADLVPHLARRRPVAWLSAFTFLIYIAHEPAVTFVRHGLFAIFGSGNHLVSLTLFFAIAVLVITGIVSAGALCRYATPRLFALATGGRGVQRPQPDVAASPVPVVSLAQVARVRGVQS